MEKYIKLKFLLGLVISFNLSFAQRLQITRIDASTISTSEIEILTLYPKKSVQVSRRGFAVFNKDKIVSGKMGGYKNIEAGELLDNSTILSGLRLVKLYLLMYD